MANNNEFKVVIFDVGEGNSAAIGFPVGDKIKWGIIDCCQASYQDEPPVLKFLREEKIEELEFICLTHLHYDHYRGLSQVLQYYKAKKFPIHSFWRCGVISIEAVYSKMLAHAHKVRACCDISDKETKLITEYEKGISSARTIELGKIMAWRDEMLEKKKKGDIKFRLKKLHGVTRDFRTYGDDLSFHCLAPISITEEMCEDYLIHIAGDLPKAIEEESKLANLASVILMVTFRGIKILFGGDAGVNIWNEAIEEAIEKEAIEKEAIEKEAIEKEAGENALFNKEEIKADLVMASHHGSKYSSSEELWSSILCKNALVAISASYYRNPYKHPDIKTLEDLRQVSHKCFPIRIACTNTHPICCKIIKRKADRRFKDSDIHHVELLRVLPNHGFSFGTSAKSQTCFGEMHILINPKDAIPVSIVKAEGGATRKCHYLSFTGPIIEE